MFTSEYVNLLIELRNRKPNWGHTAYRYEQEVREVLELSDSRSLLDFGCGTCSLEATLPEYLRYEGYDPAVAGKEKMPGGKFDTVVCIDVMEHVEEEFAVEVLRTIYQKAEKAVFYVISCVPAQGLLPDGQNAHITLKRPKEWLKLIREDEYEEWSCVTDHETVLHFVGFKTPSPKAKQSTDVE
jgi:2-polyprenyl-3-methyl-5-hydroxy-6-metoxy-1,4-benzoquinol methylase